MKNKRLFILVLVLFVYLFAFKVSAQDICSKNGYSVITINGIFTNEDGAILNKKKLKENLPFSYNNEPINVDYVYNPTHLGGVGDLVDVARQGLFDPKSDYDLVEMLNSASDKVKTQKLLIVGHSQGNFYANNFYDKVANMEGGVPAQSIGVYGVASPDSRVAGGGDYLTSDTDQVIAVIVGRLKNILKPNTHIELQREDGNGHSFSDVYLKYRSKEIVSSIKSSFDKLKTNTIQEAGSPCLSPQKLSLMHKITGVVLATGDFLVNGGVKVITGTYNTTVTIAKSVGTSLANTFTKLTKSSLALVGLADNPSEEVAPPEQVSERVLKVGENNNIDTTSSDQEKINMEPNGGIDPINSVDVGIIKSETKMPIVLGNGGKNSGEEAVPIIPDPITPPEVTNPLPEIPKDETPDKIAPVITLVGDSDMVLGLNEPYLESGASAMDDKDGVVQVSIEGSVDTSILGNSLITYTAIDKAGNIATLTRNIKIATYRYIPKYIFGHDNGDGKAWQIWAFNGSNIYDWTDMYIDNYLHEQFKIQSYGTGFWCRQCLQRGIFSKDPQKGFESNDLRSISSLEGNPQNNMNDTTYDISIQWDSLGYSYTISHGAIIDSTGRTDVPNMNNNLWVGWNGSDYGFTIFPLGTWQGIYASPEGRTGGSDMLTKPYPIYLNPDLSKTSMLSFPYKGPRIGNGVSPTRGRENVTPFIFEVIYKDSNNNPPQNNIVLHVLNTDTGNNLPLVNMIKNSQEVGSLNDGNFANGESYIVDNLLYDTGNYEYYFTTSDSARNSLRLPENDNLDFSVIPSSYKYIPKYTFGKNNGDGNDWQVWSFNGSNVYDWSDTYTDNYLHEQFKLQSYTGGFWCSQCLQRGIFKHDPQRGFETSDVYVSSLENSPQNNMNGLVYDISIQWDPLGYTYIISHDSILDAKGHTEVTNMNNNLWVGWDGTFNNFKTFPSGNWQGLPYGSQSKTGGSDIIVTPYPVFDPSAVQVPPPTPIPDPVLSSDKAILSFNFESLNPKVFGIVNETDHTVNLTVPYGTDISSLSPSIVVSDKTTIAPLSLELKDFTLPITYTLVAEDNSIQTYLATVTMTPKPEPNPDDFLPTIDSYTLNGNQSSLTLDPIINNLSIVLNTNKNVNWMSIKIEKADDIKIYKTLQSNSTTCIDGTNVCAKVWEGDLSKGGLLQDGNYRIKVHIQDSKKNDYEKYLDSIVTVVGQSVQILSTPDSSLTPDVGLEVI